MNGFHFHMFRVHDFCKTAINQVATWFADATWV